MDHNNTLNNNKNCFIFNKKKEGEYKMYYENGQLRKICNYINGKQEGKEEIYDNGRYQLYEKCNYKNDKLDGEYKQYDKNRKVIIICNYKNNEIEEEILIYFD
jgi:antitoxin component YwqK of YwqJK toxin-antitoxin module